MTEGRNKLHDEELHRRKYFQQFYYDDRIKEDGIWGAYVAALNL
jgi:hypothetical protein